MLQKKVTEKAIPQNNIENVHQNYKENVFCVEIKKILQEYDLFEVFCFQKKLILASKKS